MMSLHYKSAWELADLIAQKEISPLEVMHDTLERMDRVNPDLNAFVALRPEAALAEAAAITEKIAKGEKMGPLVGLPLGVKDLEDTTDMVTSYGSIPFKENLARKDSIQVARLKAAGAIVVGKTNVPEFGFTGFTKNRLHGITRNPFNLERTPGGSSGGSAAAIAGGLVPLCTGSDAGGSIRIPSSYSGCFGFKPSFGRIPVGPAPFVSYSAMIVMGPLTRCVRDAALYMDCTMGHHPADPYSLPAPANPYLASIDAFPKRLKIAFSPNLGYAVVQKEIMTCVEKAVQAFEEMGHHVELWPGHLPDTGDVWGALIATDIYAQISEVLENDRDQIGRTLVAVLDQTRNMTVVQLTAIQRLRAELNAGLEKLFDEFDLTWQKSHDPRDTMRR
ncbi:MAG: amidase [Desulfosarcina sp.]|nr:amidase [Desulfobacterales bacterium]